MEDKESILESLLEKTVEYGKTSLDLYKLKVLDKASDALSSIAPNSAVFIFSAFFLLFLSLGLALYLGEILEGIFYGFFLVAAFYGLLAVIIKFVLHKSIKKSIQNYIIKQVLK